MKLLMGKLTLDFLASLGGLGALLVSWGCGGYFLLRSCLCFHHHILFFYCIIYIPTGCMFPYTPFTIFYS